MTFDPRVRGGGPSWAFSVASSLRSPRCLTGLAVLAIVALFGANAEAATPREDARAAFRRGKKCFDGGDYRCALSDYIAAYDLFSSYKIDLNIAVTYARLGRPDRAADHYTRFLDRAPSNARGIRWQQARAALAELRRSLGRIVVTCEIVGAKVTLNGEAIGATPMDREMHVRPGSHRLTVTKKGYATDVRRVIAPAMTRRSVLVVLRRVTTQEQDTAAADGQQGPTRTAESDVPLRREAPKEAAPSDIRNSWWKRLIPVAALAGGALAASVVLRVKGDSDATAWREHQQLSFRKPGVIRDQARSVRTTDLAGSAAVGVFGGLSSGYGLWLITTRRRTLWHAGSLSVGLAACFFGAITLVLGKPSDLDSDYDTVHYDVSATGAELLGAGLVGLGTGVLANWGMQVALDSILVGGTSRPTTRTSISLNVATAPFVGLRASTHF